MTKLFTILGILFYAGVIVIIGMTLIVFSLKLLTPDDISAMLFYTQGSSNSRFAIGLSGLLLVLISFSFAQLILGRFQREKTIAFTTPTGEVTVALTAMEDLIKRLAVIMPEIKELRPDVIASKKGIVVDLRVVLKSEANIPELTSRLQDATRLKIQEILGVEEQIIIKVHVVKIIPGEEKRNKEMETNGPNIPFSGYGKA